MVKKSRLVVSSLVLGGIILSALAIVTILRTGNLAEQFLGQTGGGLQIPSARARVWLAWNDNTSWIVGRVSEALREITLPPLPPGQREPNPPRPIPPTFTHGEGTYPTQALADFFVWMMTGNGAGPSMRALMDFQDVADVVREYQAKLSEINNNPRLSPEEKEKARNEAKKKAMADAEEEKKDLKDGGFGYAGALKTLKKAAASGRGGLSPSEQKNFQQAVENLIDGIDAKNVEVFGKCFKFRLRTVDAETGIKKAYAAPPPPAPGGNEEDGCILPLPENARGRSQTMSPLSGLSISTLAEPPENTNDIYYYLLYFHNDIYGGQAFGDYANLEPVVRSLLNRSDAGLMQFTNDLKKRYGDRKTLFRRILTEQGAVTDPLLPRSAPHRLLKGNDWVDALLSAKPFWRGIFAQDPGSDMINLVRRLGTLQRKGK